MFSLDVIDTDLFLEMPTSSQALYFQLGMRADDDGFVSSPKKITKISNCGEDDLRLLASKGYIIPFGSGVVVITHWNINNNKIKGDRYKPTIYNKEKLTLTQENGAYLMVGTEMVPECLQIGDNVEPQNRLDKNRIDKNNIYSSNFCTFWGVYPNKADKAAAYKCYQARLKDGYSEEELLRAAKNYVKECEREKREKKYIKHAKTFLGPNTPFVDYLGEKKDDKAEQTEVESGGSAADYYKQFLYNSESDQS